MARERGIEAVGMRSVAGQLGVTPMALYRHVDGPEALQHQVVELLLAGLPVVDLDDHDRSAVRSWAVAARGTLLGAPGLARYVLLHWTSLAPTLRCVDRLGRWFEQALPVGADPVAASNAVFTYVLMRVQAEEAVRAGGLHRDLATVRAHQQELAFLWRRRAEYRTARLDHHFTYGLDALLRGIWTAGADAGP